MYQALYRKYRPKSFVDVVGQEHVTRTLTNEISEGRPSHAYLLMGSRGTGKTTCAKLIAKAVNCLHPVDGSPCGECEICRGIDDGSLVDVVEIDAASNNGVDNIRDLREEANFLPTVAKYRVYIIDEAHMLSQGAVNALLKIMEEPPAHVIFILATTEVHKIPATIRSRCQRFDFKRISTENIAARLKYICESENINATEDALLMIGRMADGGMRDAISLLDLCHAHSKDITEDTVSEAAGMVGKDHLFQLSDCIRDGKAEEAIKLIADLSQNAVEYDRLCEQLVEHFRNIMVAATVKNPASIIVAVKEDIDRYEKCAKQFKLSRVMYIIDCLQKTQAAMKQSSGRRIDLELCLSKLCTPQGTSPEALLDRIEELEAKVRALSAEIASGEIHIAPATSANMYEDETAAQPEKEQTAEAPKEEKKISPDEVLPEHQFSLSSSQPDPEIIAKVNREIEKASDPNAPAPARRECPCQPATPVDCWDDILARIGKLNPALRGVLLGSQAYYSGKRVLIDCGNPIFTDMMRNNAYTKESLKRAIAEVTGQKYSIGPYDPPKKDAIKVADCNMDDIIARAESLGIEVKEI